MTVELVINVCASLPTHALIVGVRHSDTLAGTACCRWRRHAFQHHHTGPVQSCHLIVFLCPGLFSVLTLMNLVFFSNSLGSRQVQFFGFCPWQRMKSVFVRKQFCEQWKKRKLWLDHGGCSAASDRGSLSDSENLCNLDLALFITSVSLLHQIS